MSFVQILQSCSLFGCKYFTRKNGKNRKKHIDVLLTSGYTISNVTRRLFCMVYTEHHIQKGADYMVFEKLKEIILDQLDVDEDEVTMDADFIDDLQADSLAITLLMKTSSEEFDIAVEDDTVDKISTVGDAVEFIESYINE